MERVKDFWIRSYKSDRKAFYAEIIGFVFTVSASLYLAIHADQPDLRFVYPGFFIGAAASVYASLKRSLVWPLLLTSYFCVVNVFGFGRAMGWW